ASIAVVLVINTPLLTAYSTPHERTALLGLNNALNFLAGIVGSFLGGFLPGFFARPALRSSGLLTTLQPVLVVVPRAQSYALALLARGALALPHIIPILLMHEERPSQPAPVRAARADSQVVEPEKSKVAPHRPPHTPSWRRRLA